MSNYGIYFILEAFVMSMVTVCFWLFAPAIGSSISLERLLNSKCDIAQKVLL